MCRHRCLNRQCWGHGEGAVARGFAAGPHYIRLLARRPVGQLWGRLFSSRISGVFAPMSDPSIAPCCFEVDSISMTRISSNWFEAAVGIMKSYKKMFCNFSLQ